MLFGINDQLSAMQEPQSFLLIEFEKQNHALDNSFFHDYSFYMLSDIFAAFE